MRWRSLLFAGLCSLLSATAIAQILFSPTFPRLNSACSTFTGPLDIVPGATACYFFGACSRALACAKAPAIIVSEADGTHPTTIHVTGAGILNQSELAGAFVVNSTTQVFDQTSNVLGLDIKTQTGSSRPTTAWPCDTLAATSVCANTVTTGTASWKSSVNFTPATGIVSYAVMARRNSGGTAFCPFLAENSRNTIASQNAQVNTWVINRTSDGFILAGASDGSFHAAVGVINGASSVINIDGAETTGTVNGDTVAGLIQGLTGASGDPCWEGEAIFWDNVVLTSTQRTALINNIKAFWGI